MDRLKNSLLIAGIAALGWLGAAPAQAQSPLDALGAAAGAAAGVAASPFFWGGHNYCWYPDGWHGPGWYWCGYGARVGYGWGGGEGWHHWHHGAYRGHGGPHGHDHHDHH